MFRIQSNHIQRHFQRQAVLLAAVLASASISGCFLWTSADQGSTLERRANELEARVTAMETTSAGYTAQMEGAHSKVVELEAVLQQATQVVTRNSADTGARVDELQQALAVQSGQIDELRHELSRIQEEFHEQQGDYENRMKRLARRAGVDMPVDETEIPASPDDHYRAAQVAYEARDFSTARALFRAFVSRYGSDARADDAQAHIGQSYLVEDRPATALGELRRVITEFASGDQVPAALLGMGDSFYRLHDCENARVSYDTLMRAHPRSPQAADARTRLRDVQRAPAGYCTAH